MWAKYTAAAHGADEPTPRVVGLVENEYLLATTGKCNRSGTDANLR
jgi:hypothetical protein